MSDGLDINEYILVMDGITKIYGNGFIANKNIDLRVKKGEIHALIGENGAGKSTLMKVLFGQEQAEEGRIIFKGEQVHITNPLKALELGIGMVHQHFMLVPSLTVAENMVLGIEPKKRGFFDFNQAVKLTQEISLKYKLPIDPLAKIADLPVGFKQRVEILKILLRGVDILILDEPTAVLTPQETEELFVQLRELRKNGYTIIFISHKLNEVKALCDRVTILRDGRVTGIDDVKNLTEKQISRMMVGRDVMLTIDKDEAKPKEKLLEVKNLHYVDQHGKHVVKNVSFSVRKGEILGIAGIEGNGQREMSNLISGLENFQLGEIIYKGASVVNKSIRELREKNISHISEDRMTFGTVSDATIEENLISDRFYKSEFNKFWLFNNNYIKQHVNQLIEQYNVKCDNKDALMKTLSGGNMQKVVVAREFSLKSDFVIANQPTRGIDVGSSEFIRNKLVELRDEGAAVLLISADLTEIIEVSDSIIVMFEGEVVAYLDNQVHVSEEELGEYMLGLKIQTPQEIGKVMHYE
jgi:general nucleoside transport system ATP-binding protein